MNRAFARTRAIRVAGPHQPQPDQRRDPPAADQRRRPGRSDEQSDHLRQVDIVSSDIIKDPRASIVDLGMTQVVDGDVVKAMSWYDNEWAIRAS
jgi:hypothetical protein